MFILRSGRGKGVVGTRLLFLQIHNDFDCHLRCRSLGLNAAIEFVSDESTLGSPSQFPEGLINQHSLVVLAAAPIWFLYVFVLNAPPTRCDYALF